MADFDGNGTVLSASVIGARLHPQTAGEVSAGVTPSNRTASSSAYDLHRIGLVPNSPGARAANTTALKKLLDPLDSTGPRGAFIFPNTTGDDVYYLGDIIPVRDGCSFDLQGCTLHFTKTAVASDVNAGFIMAIRDFSIENGAIDVDYNAGGTANRGAALVFGQRGTDSAYFSPMWDSLEARPMGNITVRNLRIRQNTALSKGMLMFGGLKNMLFENIDIDGHSSLSYGIGYEFGWATDEAHREDRQTSHMSEAVFRNIRIKGCTAGNLHLGGAYNVLVDGLYTDGGPSALGVTTGESLFYRPWAGVDDTRTERNIRLRNIVAKSATGTAITLTGAQMATGYLRPLGLGPKDETDLLNVSLDGFAVIGSAGFGVACSAGKVSIKNGYMRECVRGIVLTDECTRFEIDTVTVLDSGSIGIQLNQAVSIWSPARLKVGSVKNSFIAGSGTAGTAPAISVGNCESVLIENNRLGYELIRDGVAETTQSQAVNVSANGFGVVCRSNYVGGTSGGAVAYLLAGALSSPRGCSIENARGVVTRMGRWLDNGTA